MSERAEILLKEAVSMSKIMPTFRYENAPEAIAWLCRAFGFEKSMVVPGPDDTIAHAQLSFGADSMIMLGSASNEGDYGQLVSTPAQLQGCTNGVYVIVQDVDAHHDRAKAAGAVILIPPADQGHGGRLYTCRDLEGYVWGFGSYDPWASG
jgi:uncharacterized glyoxalase superfamily protein PhnB